MASSSPEASFPANEPTGSEVGNKHEQNLQTLDSTSPNNTSSIAQTDGTPTDLQETSRIQPKNQPYESPRLRPKDKTVEAEVGSPESIPPDRKSYGSDAYDNGYQFPPDHTWVETTVIAMTGLWKFTIGSWLGFLIVIYSLNVVAWGGMIFLLLVNAAPEMCHPTCNNINSPRRKWIEWDSQILTALFCVTGFGLIPWRFRDLYYLLRYRMLHEEVSLRRLAGIHRGWFRLGGSQGLPPTLGPQSSVDELAIHPETSVPFPLEKIPDAPLTGIRAPPTPVWKLDYVIWLFVWNTFLQAVLSGIMWGLNRYNRPSWTTGLFVALACIVAGMAGFEMFSQGQKVKAVEGVVVSEKDLERLQQDKELGKVNINTLSGKIPKEKKGDKHNKKHASLEKN